MGVSCVLWQENPLSIYSYKKFNGSYCKYVKLRNARKHFLWLGGEPNHENDDDKYNQQCSHDVTKLFPFHHLKCQKKWILVWSRAWCKKRLNWLKIWSLVKWNIYISYPIKLTLKQFWLLISLSYQPSFMWNSKKLMIY